MKKQKLFYKINNQIRSNRVRLVGDNVKTDIYAIDKAIDIADNLNLDLVEINSNSNPPICKIVDYKKFLFDQNKKRKQQQKKNKESRIIVKEMRFGPNTDTNDFEFKKQHIRNFLNSGNKVKTHVLFRGREIDFKDKGEILLLRLANDLEDIALVEKLPSLEGRKMFMMLKPKK